MESVPAYCNIFSFIHSRHCYYGASHVSRANPPYIPALRDLAFSKQGRVQRLMPIVREAFLLLLSLSKFSLIFLFLILSQCYSSCSIEPPHVQQIQQGKELVFVCFLFRYFLITYGVCLYLEIIADNKRTGSFHA